jgi:pimeloyl-ACP methyl ester carboxylesterase
MTHSRSRIAGIAAALVLVALALGFWQSGLIDRAWDTARFVRWMSAGRTPVAVERRPLALVRDATTGLWGEATDADDGVVYPGDLYRPPAAERRANPTGLVLVPGASPGGKDEPLLVAFAEILAASGFTVLVPDLPGLRAQQVNPVHADDIAAAASYLSTALDRRPVAVAAISYAVGPAVIAISRQQADRPIALLLGIGGYYDAVATIAYVTTGQVRVGNDGWQKRSPNEYGKWVFIWSNLPRIASHTDRATLEAIARRKFDDPAADVADLANALGPEGRAVWQLLDNADPDRVPALIGTLPTSIRTALDGLDLAQRDLSSIEATLLLVHGADDPILPPEGSVALATAVPASELYLLESLSHVELSLASLGDAWTLWRASWSLIGWRDRLAAGGTDPE